MSGGRGLGFQSLFLILLLLVVMVVAVFVFYQWSKGQVPGDRELEEQRIAADLEKARLRAESAPVRWEWLFRIALALIIGGGGSWVVVSWLGSRRERGKGGLTIEKALLKGEELLSDEGFEVVYSWGSSFQRREGSKWRELWLHFSDVRRTRGLEGFSRHLRHIVVLNDDWDHRVLVPPGKSVDQARDWFVQWENAGRSSEKAPEESVWQALGEKLQQRKAQDEVLTVLQGGGQGG